MHTTESITPRFRRPFIRAGLLVLSLLVVFGLMATTFGPPDASTRPRRDRAERAQVTKHKPVEAREAVTRKGKRGANIEIVGGSRVPQGTFSFASFIEVDVGGGFVSLCTGSLIDPLFVVTAAHCVEDENGTIFNPAQFTLVIGRASRVDSPAANVFTVSEVFQHPDWDPAAFKNDVAVLKLSSPVAADLAQPIPFIAANDTRFNTPGQRSFAAGWGRTTGGGQLSPDLLQIGTTVISDTACDDFFTGDVDDASVLCAQVPARSTCQGDSGGPLVVPSIGGAEKQQAKGAHQKHEVKADRKKKKRRKPPPPPPPPPPPLPTDVTLIGVTSFGALSCPPGSPNGFAQLSTPLLNDFVVGALNS